MGRILDGRSGLSGRINDENEQVVRAITEAEIEHASISGRAFTWDSGVLDLGAGATFLFIKNTGNVPLIFDTIVMNGSNVVCTWEAFIGALPTTPVGTTVLATNLNEVFSTTSPEAIAFSNETAVLKGSIVSRVLTQIFETDDYDMTGIILGKNHYLQILQITESTSGSVLVTGHFENPS